MKSHLCAALLLLMSAASLPAAEPSPPPATKQLTVMVLDAAGKPVAGADVSAPSLNWGVKPLAPTNQWRLQTDEKGVAVFRLPPAGQQQFLLLVHHSNYAQVGAQWFSRVASVMEQVPASFTFQLEPGETIGGIVRAANGEPIPNAILRVSGQSTRQNIGPSETSHSVFPSLNNYLPEGMELTTDAAGRWATHHVSPDINTLQVLVVREGGARSAFTAGNVQGMTQGDKISFADLRATNAVLTLKEGKMIRGLVVDPSGKAVGNVRIIERSGRSASHATHVFTNGADGRFELRHRHAPQLLFTAEAPGYAITKHSILTAETNEVNIVLDQLAPLRIRVVGEQDEPIASAALELVPWQSQNESLPWRGVTDGSGRVTWTNAPAHEVTFWVRSDEYQVRMARVAPGQTEQVIKLRKGRAPSVAVTLKVVDANTSAPIEKFEVWRDLYGYRPFQKLTNAQGGTFVSEVSSNAFERGTGMSFRYQVRAEGYRSWVSPQMMYEEGDQGITAKLEKGTPPAGVVLQPDGQPAAGAIVYLNGNQGSLFANTPGGDFHVGQGATREKAAADGAFRFPAAEELSALVVTHPSGFLSLKLEELPVDGKLRLQPWAGLDGVLRVNGQPKKGERLHLKSPMSWTGRNNFLLVFNANTDDDGRFTFTNLPPGGYVLARTPHLIMGTSTTESHRYPFELKAGESKTIEYGFNGRTVTGRVETGGAVDFQNDPQVLAVKAAPGPEPPNYADYAEPKAYETARDAFGRSPAVQEHERRQQQFQLVFDREGNFTADDVPAGTYEVRLRFTRPSQDPRQRWNRGPEIGSLDREVTIPEGREDFDLGTFEVEVKDDATPSTPVELVTQTLENKALALSSLRGKPVVVAFWGNWAPQSVAGLAPLHTIQQELGDRVSFVTVNLDEHNDLAQVHLGALTGGWLHTVLRGTNRVMSTEQLAINTLPATLILDASGRIVSRDVSEKRLRPALQRLLTKPATQAKKP